MIRSILAFIAVFMIMVFTYHQPLLAQNVFTLEEAIQTGLENNYGLQITRNFREQAANNHSLGNAGFLPSLELTGSRTESVEDSEFEAGGERQSTTGSRSTGTNAGLNLNWTVFDGFRMFRTYDLLGVLEEISDKEVRFGVESLISQITASYYDIVRIENQLRVLENTVEVSNERIEIQETKLDLGSGSEVELLQARSDLNADRAALLRERNLLNEAIISLNELLSREPETQFIVSESIPLKRDLDDEALYEKLMAENSELEIARMQYNVANLEVSQIRSERYPELSLTSGYGYNRSETDGGFIRFNETTGFSFGVTARVNIFNGFNTNRRVQNAKINQKNSRLELEESRLRLESQFRVLYRTYQNSLELVDLEQENLSNAEQTLDVALERFRLGTISSLELREAQRTFLTAENRLIDTLYEAKIAETELLRLSGEIVVSDM